MARAKCKECGCMDWEIGAMRAHLQDHLRIGEPLGDFRHTVELGDPTNPDHYKDHPSGVECIDITRHMSFCRGNAVKYLWRAGIKDPEKEIEDLRKARWYIAEEIRRLGGEP